MDGKPCVCIVAQYGVTTEGGGGVGYWIYLPLTGVTKNNYNTITISILHKIMLCLFQPAVSSLAIAW
jgi:hypothetical protein